MHKTEDGKMHRTTVREEHISLIEKPDSIFIGHTVTLSGKAIDIANFILNYFFIHDTMMSEIVCVGCDGFSKNTRK